MTQKKKKNPGKSGFSPNEAPIVKANPGGKMAFLKALVEGLKGVEKGKTISIEEAGDKFRFK